MIIPSKLVKYFVTAVWLVGNVPATLALDCAIEWEPWQVQGSGDQSPLVGQTITTGGTVTQADFRARGQRGFFIQGRPDGRASTSDALFIYTGNRYKTGQKAPARGEHWVVRGRVKEYHGLTEITQVDALKACGQASLPAPVTARAPRESLEGMRVRLPATQVIDNFNLLRTGELWLKPGPEDTVWRIEDGSNQRNLKALPWYAEPPLAQWQAGARLAPLSGVLSWRWNQWVLLPDTPLNSQATRPEPPPPAPAQTLRLASWNLWNLFNAGPDGDWSGRSAGSARAWQGQRTKTVKALLSLDADILLVQEVENDLGRPPTALAELVAALNRAGHRQYRSVQPAAHHSTDVITNAFIYDAGRVAPQGPLHALPTQPRPTLVQRFRLRQSNLEFRLINAHLKSRAGCGVSACQAKRARAVQQLAAHLDTTHTHTLLAGDFNTRRTEPLWAPLQAAGWRALSTESPTYWYRGNPQQLDHAWVPVNAPDTVRLQVVTGHAEWPRLSPDHPLYAPTQPWGASDHNPLIIDWALP